MGECGTIQVLEPAGMRLVVQVDWRDGVVRVRCPECAMHLPDAEPGRVLCPACDGTGTRDCTACYGTGIGSTPDVPCAFCHGTGEERCPYCDTQGTVECPECRGRGHVSWGHAGTWLARQAEKARARRRSG